MIAVDWGVGSLSLISLPLFQELSEALLEEEDCNVIAVDWGGGSLSLTSLPLFQELSETLLEDWKKRTAM